MKRNTGKYTVFEDKSCDRGRSEILWDYRYRKVYNLQLEALWGHLIEYGELCSIFKKK